MGLIIKETNRYGRGVFTTRKIKKGDLIEQSPVIVVPSRERRFITKTVLSNYFFNWGRSFNDVAVALGYGSLFNHSYSPNAYFKNNLRASTVDFYAYKDIQAGEEITVNYNGDPRDSTPVWFDVK
ncbi:SET domain-containing protein [Halobacillus yeomjeoni]|uniref:SET domain-containing protein n=1 Tax=Halobacillus yeomjeoni TaxID=311194 RepID=UPI001CD25343|nr:SET domain-containing protein [Halobacillus yeomjeoni]MCA0983633.1 SET domain-containing protein [Halobacillus yeomjeoni]